MRTGFTLHTKNELIHILLITPVLYAYWNFIITYWTQMFYTLNILSNVMINIRFAEIMLPL